VGDRIKFVGHSSVRIELDGVTFLTDPLLRERFLHARRVGGPAPEDALEGLDALLVSHLHMDHLDFPSIRELDRRTPVICAAGAGRVLRRRRFRDVTELRPGESTEVGSVRITATDAHHDGRRWPLGPEVPALGYDLRGSSRVYFAGDTDLFNEMAELHGVDAALLPIGGWGPRVGEGHMDGASAAQAAALIRPRVVVPIHWGTYMRADLIRKRPELLTQQPPSLLAETARLAPDVDVRVLQPGESLDL
jgi:L-ascorbate metabolism protein UlaG (beta-lactamase superfamily)